MKVSKNLTNNPGAVRLTQGGVIGVEPLINIQVQSLCVPLPRNPYFWTNTYPARWLLSPSFGSFSTEYALRDPDRRFRVCFREVAIITRLSWMCKFSLRRCTRTIFFHSLQKRGRLTFQDWTLRGYKGA